MSEQSSIKFKDRLKGMIWGQFVGDAATLGAHWYYDLNELAKNYPNGIVGFETPVDGHYHFGKKSGDFTHYGDAAILLLQSIAESGKFSAENFGKLFIKNMSPPKYNGYIDGSTKETLENFKIFNETDPNKNYRFQNGSKSDHPATASSLAPVIAAHYKNANILEIVEAATKVRQNNNVAIKYMQSHASILIQLLNGDDFNSAFQISSTSNHKFNFDSQIKNSIQSAVENLSSDITTTTKKLGQSCPITQTFPSAVHSCLKSGNSFGDTILAIIKAGGDNAGRASMAGAWLGAHLGFSAIPTDWIENMNRKIDIKKWVNKIVNEDLNK